MCVEAPPTTNSHPHAFHPQPHARSQLYVHMMVMFTADQPLQCADSLHSVGSAASNTSLSRKPRTTQLRSHSCSATADTRRSLSILGDVNTLMSNELHASCSTLQSSSAGHSLLNSPNFNLLSNMQPSAPFLFATPVQQRPSSVEPTVPQPEPLYLHGRDQIPGPSKVSTDQMLHALCTFLSSSQPTCPCRFRC